MHDTFSKWKKHIVMWLKKKVIYFSNHKHDIVCVPLKLYKSEHPGRPCHCFWHLWFLWASCGLFLPPAPPRSTSAPSCLIDGDFWSHGEMWIPAGLPRIPPQPKFGPWQGQTRGEMDGWVVGGSRTGLRTGCVLNNFDRGVWTVSLGWS